MLIRVVMQLQRKTMKAIRSQWQSTATSLVSCSIDQGIKLSVISLQQLETSGH